MWFSGFAKPLQIHNWTTTRIHHMELLSNLDKIYSLHLNLCECNLGNLAHIILTHFDEGKTN